MATLSGLGMLYVALLVLFALIFVGALVALVRARGAGASGASIPPPAPSTSGTLREAMAVPGAVADPYLSRFVVDESGERVGETISATQERVILKREGHFHAVPAEQVHLEQGELVARGVDWDAARREGDAWQAAQAQAHEALQFDESGATRE